MNEPYIIFDMPAIYRLREVYETNLIHVKEQLPPVNWNSRDKTILFFKETFDLDLNNVRIDPLVEILNGLEHDSEVFDVLNGFVLYLKFKFTLKNYIDCIIRHNKDGRVRLRYFQGQWVLPNRQPTSMNPEITECIVAQGKGDSLWEHLQVTTVR